MTDEQMKMYIQQVQDESDQRMLEHMGALKQEFSAENQALRKEFERYVGALKEHFDDKIDVLSEGISIIYKEQQELARTKVDRSEFIELKRAIFQS